MYSFTMKFTMTEGFLMRMHLQVTDYYVQILWTEISGVRQNMYNAGVEAVSTVVSK